MLAVEHPKRPQQLVHVQPARTVDIPSGFFAEAVLQHVAQLAWHHFLIDRVRHARRRVRCQQAEIAHVLQVVYVVGRLATGQQRLEHPPHALILQLVRELIEMRPPRQDQRFPRRVDVVRGHRLRAVPPALERMR